jgi:SSS family solute:Na+ symporter
VQRYHAAKTDKAAKFSALFGGYLFIPVSALFFLIGSALYSYYQAGVAELPADIAAKPDYVFPYFIVNGLPVGLRGLLIASIFAAGMSTVSTSVTSAATIILTDYVRPFFLKARNVADRLRHHDPADHHQHQKLELAIVRLSSFGVGILGALVAIAMLSVESIIDAWWTLSSIFSGGMLGLFLLGCIPTTINRWAALAGCIAGVLVIGWISLAEIWNLPGLHLHPDLAIVLGTCIIFIVGFFLTFLLKAKR